MPKIIKIAAVEIAASLTDSTRQYLCGNLGRPQKVQHYHSEQLEIGITSYGQLTTEQTHSHTHAIEFQYMISGHTVYLDHADMSEHHFYNGDFYTIEPGVVYSQKSEPGTEIIFIKVPSVNDKVVAKVGPETEDWFQKPIEP